MGDHQIGGEAGRIIDPTAFASEPNGTFVVADAPNNRERIEIFTPAGFRIGRFLLPGRLKARVKIENAVLNGIGSLQYTGTSILMSQPETGALITEYELSGGVHRTFGRLRHTGHEDDPELHLALNSGIALVDPASGFYFVFQTGEPVLRKYDASGQLVFERRMQGREIDPLIGGLPSIWPRRQTNEGELPLHRHHRRHRDRHDRDGNRRGRARGGALGNRRARHRQRLCSRRGSGAGRRRRRGAQTCARPPSCRSSMPTSSAKRSRRQRPSAPRA